MNIQDPGQFLLQREVSIANTVTAMYNKENALKNKDQRSCKNYCKSRLLCRLLTYKIKPLDRRCCFGC
ncbi:hypothetical protein EUGRSUZ_J00065 [Eucalyptus grandis]|uniref:Uncharacterized protein n=2 Tax=Eucalyptus grandis TaxID=71139 RepID=A0ACC3J380_EUCGR|nr:hypothetical protein EUGRSUZ_J00065 [Eucalyptus grandis]